MQQKGKKAYRISLEQKQDYNQTKQHLTIMLQQQILTVTKCFQWNII